jgi:hypothetical protein
MRPNPREMADAFLEVRRFHCTWGREILNLTTESKGAGYVFRSKQFRFGTEWQEIEQSIHSISGSAFSYCIAWVWPNECHWHTLKCWFTMKGVSLIVPLNAFVINIRPLSEVTVNETRTHNRTHSHLSKGYPELAIISRRFAFAIAFAQSRSLLSLDLSAPSRSLHIPRSCPSIHLPPARFVCPFGFLPLYRHMHNYFRFGSPHHCLRIAASSTLDLGAALLLPCTRSNPPGFPMFSVEWWLEWLPHRKRTTFIDEFCAKVQARAANESIQNTCTVSSHDLMASRI